MHFLPLGGSHRRHNESATSLRRHERKSSCSVRARPAGRVLHRTKSRQPAKRLKLNDLNVYRFHREMLWTFTIFICGIICTVLCDGASQPTTMGKHGTTHTCHRFRFSANSRRCGTGRAMASRHRLRHHYLSESEERTANPGERVATRTSRTRTRGRQRLTGLAATCHAPICPEI